MITTLHVEVEARTIGARVLTTPVVQRLGFREIVNHYCPLAEPSDMDPGFVAELVAPCITWYTGQTAWLVPIGLPSSNEQNNRTMTGLVGGCCLVQQRAILWGELVANAARFYQVELHRLHADTMAMTVAGRCSDQPVAEAVPRLEPGSKPKGEWVQHLTLFALSAGDGGLPVWFDALDGSTGESTTDKEIED